MGLIDDETKWFLQDEDTEDTSFVDTEPDEDEDEEEEIDDDDDDDDVSDEEDEFEG